MYARVSAGVRVSVNIS